MGKMGGLGKKQQEIFSFYFFVQHEGHRGHEEKIEFSQLGVLDKQAS